MSPHVAAALSYVFLLVSGLIIFLMERQNRFVRFHAMQSILLSLVCFAAWYVLGILLLPLVFVGAGFIVRGPIMLVYLAIIAIMVICIVNAAQGKWFKLPIIGDIAEKQSTPTV